MKMISKLAIASLITSLPLCIAFADQPAKLNQTVYTVKITSNSSNDPISFTGSYMIMSKYTSKMVRIDNVTPYEFNIKGDDFGLMLMSQPNGDNQIKVDIIDNNSKGMLQGEGISIMAHDSANGYGFIVAK